MACEAIHRYTEGMDFAACERGQVVQDAVAYRLTVLGEALNRLARADPDIAVHIPELRRIVALRNRVVHVYDNIDDEIVWDIIRVSLPPLQDNILRSIDAHR